MYSSEEAQVMVSKQTIRWLFGDIQQKLIFNKNERLIMEKLEIDQMEKIKGGSLNRPGNICGGDAPLTLWGPTPAVAAAVAAANCIKDWWTE